MAIDEDFDEIDEFHSFRSQYPNRNSKKYYDNFSMVKKRRQKRLSIGETIVILFHGRKKNDANVQRTLCVLGQR